MWESEDGPSLRELCDRAYFWDGPLCWIDATTLAVWGEGRDDEEMLPAVRLFDVAASNTLDWFPGPDVAPHRVWPPQTGQPGWMVYHRYLFAISPQRGTSVWDIVTGERLLHDAGFVPLRYHHGAAQFLTLQEHGAITLSNGGLEMTCLNDMPNFIPTRSGAGTVAFLYDRPASYTTTVVWGSHGDDWDGWIADAPGGGAEDRQRASLSWQTPIDAGRHAQDVALRFRAHLVPPPITDTATLTPEPVAPAPPLRSGMLAPGQGAVFAGASGSAAPSPTPGAVSLLRHTGKPRSCATLASGWTRCVWSLSDIPTERERFAAEPSTWIVAAQARSQPQPLDAPEDDQAPVPTPGVTQPLGSGGPVRHTFGEATTPTSPPIENTIAIVATLPDRLMLRAPDQPEHLGPLLTITSRVAEQVQITVRYDDPAMPGPSDQDTLTVALPAGTLANYAAPRMGVTVPPGTAPGVQVCLSFEWRGLMSGASGTTRACTVTADPTSISPTLPPVPSGPGDSGALNCAPLVLVRLPGVTAPDPRLVAPAAASFAAVRADIQERTGIDALAVLADVLRQPSFTTSKSGVLQTSWHKAGRAIDLNQGGPFVRVAEGQQFRLYVSKVDVTAIFEAHGWQRIPVQGDTSEWWHYEWHPDGIAWTSAMLQIWNLPTLQAAFPKIAWGTLGCTAGSNTGPGDSSTSPQETAELCVLGTPRYRSAVETFPGCGPPLRAGDNVAQLDTTLGFVGLSGRTSGPHLHLGLKVRSYDGSWPLVDICTPEWLQGRAPPADASCFTDMADPLAFLPQAPGNSSAAREGAPALRQQGAATATPIIPEGAPYQLPPPNYPNALVFTPVPNATPVGQYWSPYADSGQYGGGSVGAWFCTNVWAGFPWCNAR